jgi:dipeptidyl aminopeptidase/acylaminoacyl peptidase
VKHRRSAVRFFFIVTLGCFLWAPLASAQEKKAPEEELKAEDIQVPSVDGFSVYACIRKPDGDGPFPAIIVVHGGLGEQGRNALRSNLLGVGTPVMEAMYKAGYVVVMSDFRRHDFGGKEIDDVAAVFNHVLTLPYVDKTQVGIYGASHGGYIALMVATRVRPAAAVACAPVVDVLDEFRRMPAPPATPPIKPSARREIALELADKLGGTPDTVPERYQALSILTRVDQISCPVLVIQGTGDQLLSGSKLLKAEMDRAGKPCELALYPDQPHGFYWGLVRVGGVNQATRDALAKTLSFFGQYLRK